ncbi:hypothetical protein [Sphingomonas faeni]|uniref:hypothetical protein n=1 Tax=Sphingomonas faeni TaxID=185950 RepID=UPI0033553371
MAHRDVRKAIAAKLLAPFDMILSFTALVYSRVYLGESLPVMLLAAYLGIPIEGVGLGRTTQG